MSKKERGAHIKEIYINLEKSSCDFMNKITETEQTLGTMKEITGQT